MIMKCRGGLLERLKESPEGKNIPGRERIRLFSSPKHDIDLFILQTPLAPGRDGGGKLSCGRGLELRGS